jgi:hypothetical protein
MEETMVKYKVISGAVPETLTSGQAVTFNFGLPDVPDRGSGLLFYMVDTREGEHAYRQKGTISRRYIRRLGTLDKSMCCNLHQKGESRR